MGVYYISCCYNWQLILISFSQVCYLFLSKARAGNEININFEFQIFFLDIFKFSVGCCLTFPIPIWFFGLVRVCIMLKFSFIAKTELFHTYFGNRIWYRNAYMILKYMICGITIHINQTSGANKSLQKKHEILLLYYL